MVKASALACMLAVAAVPTSAYGASLFPDRIQLGFFNESDYARACVLSAVLSGAATSHKKASEVVSWCCQAARMLFRQTVRPQPTPDPEPAPEPSEGGG